MIATGQVAELRVTEEEFGLTIELPGDLSVGNAAEVVAAAIAAWDRGGRPGHLVLDLSAMRHMDSSGVSALMEIRQRLNVRTVLTGLQDRPRRLLERTGISRLFDVRSGAKEPALSAPGKPSPSFLWSLIWMLLIMGVLAGMIAASYPTLQQYQARVEHTQARAR